MGSERRIFSTAVLSTTLLLNLGCANSEDVGGEAAAATPGPSSEPLTVPGGPSSAGVLPNPSAEPGAAAVNPQMAMPGEAPPAQSEPTQSASGAEAVSTGAGQPAPAATVPAPVNPTPVDPSPAESGTPPTAAPAEPGMEPEPGAGDSGATPAATQPDAGLGATPVIAPVGEMNLPPQITDISASLDFQGEAGVEQYKITVEAEDANGDALSYDFALVSGDGDLTAASDNTIVFAFRERGDVTVSVTVSDAAGGMAVQEFSFQIPTLEGNFYYDRDKWNATVGGQASRAPYAYVERNDSLPNVLLIGDSISIGYTATVRQQLAGEANVYRIPQNGSSSDAGLANLPEWLANVPWAVVHFNFGLHDLKYLRNGNLTLPSNGGVQVNTLEEYQSNLEEILQHLTSAPSVGEVIWATTTQTPAGAAGRIAGDSAIYNERAQLAVDKFPSVPTNDLYALMLNSPNQGNANVHYNAAGSAQMGTEVAKHIRAKLTAGD